MELYDNDGNIVSLPMVSQSSKSAVSASTFFADDRCKNTWHAPGSKPTPERKHEGESLMVSDFLSPEWGSLRDDEEGCMFCSLFYHFLVSHSQIQGGLSFLSGRNKP